MDQAETVLLAMLKGRNIQRLSGLQSNGELWRPWLEIMPSELEAYARDKAIHYRHDASNDATVYDRNYLRICIAPLVEDRFPGWVQSCQRAGRQIQEAQALVTEFSKRNLEPYTVALQDPYWGKVLRIAQGSREIEYGSLYARNLWRSMGANYAQENSLEQAWELAVGKTLPCGMGQVFRQRNALCYFEIIPAQVHWLREIKEQDWLSENMRDDSESRDSWIAEQRKVWQTYAGLGHQFTVHGRSEAESDWTYWVGRGWQLRPWKAGDRCTLPGGHHKLVSDLLQENRVERPFKDTWPVFCHQGSVVGCPLPSRPNRWEMKEGEGVLHWNWLPSVNYVTNQ